MPNPNTVVPMEFLDTLTTSEQVLVLEYALRQMKYQRSITVSTERVYKLRVKVEKYMVSRYPKEV